METLSSGPPRCYLQWYYEVAFTAHQLPHGNLIMSSTCPLDIKGCGPIRIHDTDMQTNIHLWWVLWPAFLISDCFSVLLFIIPGRSRIWAGRYFPDGAPFARWRQWSRYILYPSMHRQLCQSRLKNSIIWCTPSRGRMWRVLFAPKVLKV